MAPKRGMKSRGKRSKPFNDNGESHPVFDAEDERKHTKYRKVIAGDDGEHDKRSRRQDDTTDGNDDLEDDDSLVDPLEELLGTLADVSSAPVLKPSDTDTSDDDDDNDDEENKDGTDPEGTVVTIDDPDNGAPEDEDDVEDGDDEIITITNREDPFVVHFEQTLPHRFVERLRSKNTWKTTEETWPVLGPVERKTAALTKDVLDDEIKFCGVNHVDCIDPESSLAELCVKSQVHASWMKCNGVHLKGDDLKSDAVDGRRIFTDLQSELYAAMNSYSDLLYCHRTHENGEEIRAAYCLHIANHALKTRHTILQHNTTLRRWSEVPDEYRDQGLTRPKTIVLVPFRESALRVVNNLINILVTDAKGHVMNKKRFHDRYGSRSDERSASRGRLPDHDATFAGNIDDDFRLGITVTKKSMRLYTNFFESDIIVASPLGLRMIIGAQGDSERKFDFLASVEMLIIDQAEILLMQNWEHVTHVLEHLNLQPKNTRGVDFSRVRNWSLEEGWAKHYRQSLCFAGIVSPEINSLFSRTFCNYAGLIRTVAPVIGGSIRRVIVQLPQVFHRFQASSAKEEPEARFQHFVTKILPQFLRESVMSHTLIFVPSYLDYVRLRNHLRREDASFTQICEYTEPAKVAQARRRFVHSLRRHLLYTERAHFYHRRRIKSISHLVFYQLPVMPHFYSELCNLTMLQRKSRRFGGGTGAADKYLTCTVLFSRYDAHRLAAVVGTDRAAQLATSDDKDVFMFVTGET